MKIGLLNVLLMLLAVISAFGQNAKVPKDPAQQTAVTEDGRSVVLNSDGT